MILKKILHKETSEMMGCSYIDHMLNVSEYGNFLTAYIHYFAKKLKYRTELTQVMAHGSVLEQEVVGHLKNYYGVAGVPITKGVICGANWHDSDVSEVLTAQIDMFDPHTKGLIEIKCPAFEKDTKKLLDRYMWQLQGQLAVTSAERLAFVIYFKDFKDQNNSFDTHIVERNEDMINVILSTMRRFKHAVDTKEFHHIEEVREALVHMEICVKSKKLAEALKRKAMKINVV